jgi:hypothetical protein
MKSCRNPKRITHIAGVHGQTDRQTQIGREVKIPQQSNNAYWKTKDKYSAEGDNMLLK